MRYTSIEKKADRISQELKQQAVFKYGSEIKYMDPKAYSRFKSMNTDYSSKRKCRYGEKNKKCDPCCIFWMTCRHGRQEKEWKGDEKNE